MFNEQEKKNFCDETQIRKADIGVIIAELEKNGYKLTKHNKNNQSNKISKQYLLGSGGQANVFHGVDLKTGENVAIKISNANKNTYEQMKEEQKIIQNIKCHKYIVNIYQQILLDDQDICIQIMELCEMSLDDEISLREKNNQPYSIQEVANIMFSAINALYEIHSNDIIHFDIKPSNILKSFNGDYKLTDFGMSRQLSYYKSQTINFGLGTIFFASPEQALAIQSEPIINKNNNLSEIQQVNEEQLGEDRNKIKFKNTTDIYSMGVSLLGILGVQMNFVLYQWLNSKQFDKIEEKVQQQNINFYKFIKYYMLPSSIECRSTAIRLRQRFLNDYGYLISYDNEIKRISDVIEAYTAKNYKKDKHYAYLLLSLSQSKRYSVEEDQIIEALGILQQINLVGKIDEVLFHQEYGQILRRRNQHSLALEQNEKAFQILQNIKDDMTIEIAYAFLLIGDNLQNLANFEKALAFVNQSLEIRRILYEDKHPDIFESQNKLAEIYLKIGNEEAGLEKALQAFEMIESIYSDKHPQISKSLNIINVAYSFLENYNKSLEYELQSLEMRKSLYLKNHPDIAESLNNVGIIYQSLGQNEKGLEYQLQALEMSYKFHSGQHPLISQNLVRISVTYMNLKDFQSALKYSLEGIEMIQSIYKTDHPDITNSYSVIALIYEQIGQLDKAEDYIIKAIKMCEKIYQVNNHIIAQQVYQLGQIYFLEKKYTLAIEQFMKAKNIFEQSKIRRNKFLYCIIHKLGNCYLEMEQFEQAEEMLCIAIQMYSKIQQEDNPIQLSCIKDLAELYFKQNDYNRAIIWYLQAQEMAERCYSNNNALVQIIIKQIGYCYLQIGLQYSNDGMPHQSLEYFLKNYETLSQLSSENNSEKVVSLQRIAFCYEELKDYLQSELYCQLAIDIQNEIDPKDEKMNELINQFSHRNQKNIKFMNLIINNKFFNKI